MKLSARICEVCGNKITGEGARFCSRSCKGKFFYIVSGINNKDKKFSAVHKEKIGMANKISSKLYREAHGLWKGMLANIKTKHRYVKNHKGKPSKCEHCGTTTASNYDWANVDHKYSRKLSDYIRLCRSCHRQYDIKNNNYKTNGYTKCASSN
jgi:hypothetical protein